MQAERRIIEAAATGQDEPVRVRTIHASSRGPPVQQASGMSAAAALAGRHWPGRSAIRRRAARPARRPEIRRRPGFRPPAACDSCVLQERGQHAAEELAAMEEERADEVGERTPGRRSRLACCGLGTMCMIADCTLGRGQKTCGGISRTISIVAQRLHPDAQGASSPSCPAGRRSGRPAPSGSSPSATPAADRPSAGSRGSASRRCRAGWRPA